MRLKACIEGDNFYEVGRFNWMNKYFVILFLIFCNLLLFLLPAYSQDMGSSGRAGDGAGISFSTTYMHQFNADLDGGGDFSVDRLFLRADAKKRLSDTFTMGIGINYVFHDYSFADGTFNPLSKPWKQVHALDLSVNSLFVIDKGWNLFVAPSIGVAGASGANWSDSLIYGGIIWTSYRLNPGLLLGAGAGLFSKQKDFSGFPIIVVDWKISDRLRLSNPVNPGPTGPAGLELSYMFDEVSSVAMGGAYRSLRFRLSNSSTLSDGIGEDKAFPLWIRFSTKIGSLGTLSLHGGTMVGGKLTLRDSWDNKVAVKDYKSSPFLSATLMFKF
ncbi:MAG: DUF6268 family outer membrane beta-barrel protein [Thermodesulfovibrionales bacterium]